MAFFEECDDILNNVIGEKILRNQNLCKLLYYYSDTNNFNFNPLNEPNIEDTSKLLMNYIYPLPKSPNLETEQKGFLTVVLSGADDNYFNSNTGYRKLYLIFDIIVHLNQWIIEDSYRVYKIAEELDKMFNYQQTDLPILGRPSYVNFKQRDYSNYFYGLQLIYGFTVNSNIVCDPIPQNLNIKEQISNKKSFSNILNRKNIEE